MSHFLVRCETLQYDKELIVCLTKTQFDKLKYKIQNNLIKYKVSIAYGSDSENVCIKIIDFIPISKFTYDQIKDFIGNQELINDITNKTKFDFWYTKMEGSYIVEDFIKNKLNKLEHDGFEFRFEEGGIGTIHISQHFGKIVLSNNKHNSIKGFDLSHKEIIEFLIETKNG